MAVKALERTFEFNIGTTNLKLTDPNPSMQEKDVLSFYALQYPEINNAVLSEKKTEDDKIKYIYQSKFGTKG